MTDKRWRQRRVKSFRCSDELLEMIMGEDQIRCYEGNRFQTALGSDGGIAAIGASYVSFFWRLMSGIAEFSERDVKRL